MLSAAIVWMTGSDGLPTKPSTPENQFDFRNASPVEGEISIVGARGGIIPSIGRCRRLHIKGWRRVLLRARTAYQ